MLGEGWVRLVLVCGRNLQLAPNVLPGWGGVVEGLQLEALQHKFVQLIVSNLLHLCDTNINEFKVDFWLKNILT